MAISLLLLLKHIYGISVLLQAVVVISPLSAACLRDDDKLLEPSELEKFVDEVPDMPRLIGYELLHGIPKPKSLNIGMFQKNWILNPDRLVESALRFWQWLHSK